MSAAKRKRLEKEETKTLKRLGDLLDASECDDYQFVCAKLDPKAGEQRQHVKKVADMIRKGTFDKLDALREVANDASQPAPCQKR